MKKTKIVSLVLCLSLIISSLLGTVTFAEQHENAQLKGNVLSNEFLELAVSEKSGRFTIGTSGGNPDISTDNNKKMLYGHPISSNDSGGTSYTTIVIDEKQMKYGNDGFVSKPEFNVQDLLNTSTVQYGNIIVSQTLKIVKNISTDRYDVVEIKYDITNEDNVSHNVGTRIMFDTMLGGNDSAPFRIPGLGNVTKQTELTGEDIPQYWQAFDSLENTQVVSQGSLLRSSDNRPDKVQFTSWNNVAGTAWNAPIYSGSGNGDSAVTITWNEKALEAGETRSYTTYYGLSELVQDLAPPLAVSVYGDSSVSLKSFDFLRDDPYEPNPITITAYIKNIGNGKASNVYSYLKLPTCMSVVEGNNRQEKTTLNVNEEIQVSWKVKIEPLDQLLVLPISVVVGADNAEEKTIVRDIKIPEAKENNQINFGRDNFNFTNSPDAFVKSENMISDEKWNENYNLSEEYFNKLTEGMSKNVKDVIRKRMQSIWGGSCYGMSNVVALIKAGSLTPDKWQDGISKTHDLNKPNTDTNIENLINFYHLSFSLPDIMDIGDNFHETTKKIDDFVYDDSEWLKQIVDEANKVKDGGLPVNICYAWTDKDDTTGAHSILAYAVDKGIYTDTNATKYKYRVSICDPNYSSRQYLYISEDYSKWHYDRIDPIYKNGIEEKYIYTVLSDYSTIDIINPEKNINRTRLKEYNKNFIKNYTVGSIIVSNGQYNTEINGINLNACSKMKTASKPVYGLEPPNSTTIVQDSGEYTITPNNAGGEIDCFRLYENQSMSAKAKSCNSATFDDKKKEVSLDINNCDYEISLTFNDGYENLPWSTIEVQGQKAQNASLRQINGGMLLSSDNLLNTKISGTNYDAYDISLAINTNQKSVLLKELDKNTLGAYVDNDNNGTYETLISTSDTEIKSYMLKKPDKVVNVKSIINKADKIKISWKKQKNIDGYEVILHKPNKRSIVRDTKKNSYTFNKILNSATTYKFTVRAYKIVKGIKIYGESSAIYKTATSPKKVKWKSLKKASSKKVRLKWKKVKGSTGYVIYRKKGSKYKKVKTVKKKTTVILKVKKGKKYTYKMRAYKKVGKKKIYGKYSSAKKYRN